CSSPLSGLRLPVLCWPIMRKRLAFHQESSILSRAWARMLGPRWWLTQASDASRLPVHLRLREALAKRQQKILLLWASNLNAGTVWVNCYYIRDLGTPFGGNKLSGIGRAGGLWSFEFYCDVQTICHRLGTFQG